MPQAELPANEYDRIRALWACDVLDTAAEESFDDITKLAAKCCQVPIALISLIDSERQWFKSKIGINVAETPREFAFCAHAIRSRAPLIIEDATLDVRTSDNPLVTGEPFIRFYVGIPLLTAAGFALGSLCVIDTKPNNLTPDQLETLTQLAHQTVALLELRREQRTNRRMSQAMNGGRYGIIAVAVGAFLIGLAVTAVMGYWSHRNAVVSAGERFDRVSERVTREIARRGNLPFYGLKGARGVYAASKSVERDEFAAYVASRDLKREFPGVTGMGFMARVDQKDLADFVTSERADNAPGFAFHSGLGRSADATDFYVAKFVEPLEPNRAAWGYDLGSDPVIRATAEAAVRSGDSLITAQVSLDPLQADYLAIVPVYRNKTSPRTPDQRVAALTGLLYANVRIDDAMAGAYDLVEEMADFRIYPATGDDQQHVLFDTRSHPARQGEGANTARSSRFSFTTSAVVGNRKWNIQTFSTPRFEASVESYSTAIIAAGGTMLSGLLALVIHSIGQSRARAFALADNITSDLHEAKNRAERTASELQAQSTEMQATSDMLRRTGEMARVGGWEVDLEKMKITWSREVYLIHEVPLGAPISLAEGIAFYAPEAQPVIRAAVQTAIDDGQSWDLELPLITAKGNRLWVRAQGECMKRNGKPVKLRGAFQDITARREAEEKLRISATHDKLTGLPNRSLLNDRLQQRFGKNADASTGGFAVLFLDFDRFKHINDTLGHEAGDDLLKQISARLLGCLRQGDLVERTGTSTTVGRLGGDEFVIILDRIAQPQDASAVAARLLQALSEPYRLAGHEMVSTASIGVVTSGPTYTKAEDMLRDADIAMYEAKLAGKGRYVVFDSSMHERIECRVKTENDLRVAIAQQQMFLVYQPIVCLETGTIRGVEALLRWNHPTRGLISPGEFIPIAEETGLIVPIGEWVLRTACRQFVAWQTHLASLAPPTLSVNLSRKQLMLRDLPELVKSILSETGMTPEALHLEVTESTVMKDPQTATRILKSIKAIGPRIDLDDFGTGHSSLASLHQYPVDVLKIDRSFIANVNRGREFAALVQAIAQLARNMHMEVVAEGVETPEQVALLQTMDCAAAQGFFFSKPLAANALEDYLRTGISINGGPHSMPAPEIAAA